MKKRLQKLFAVLLTLSMVMSLMSVTAFAEEEATIIKDEYTNINERPDVFKDIKFMLYNYTGDSNTDTTVDGINSNGIADYFKFRGTHKNNTTEASALMPQNTIWDDDGYTADRVQLQSSLTDTGRYPVVDTSRAKALVDALNLVDSTTEAAEQAKVDAAQADINAAQEDIDAALAAEDETALVVAQAAMAAAEEKKDAAEKDLEEFEAATALVNFYSTDTRYNSYFTKYRDDIKALDVPEGVSLGVLFGGDGGTAVETHNPENTILRYNPDTKTYSYSSKLNAVDYEDGRFYVQDYTERTSVSEKNYDHDGNDFLPFNNGINGRTQGKTEAYLFDSNTEVDYWFGMTMEYDFWMPAGGKIDGKEMVFEFSGDDDVWVFIDDQLVLDLGGTHGTVSGKINFADGTVTQYLSWMPKEGVDPKTITEGTYEDTTDANGVTTRTWTQEAISFPTTLQERGVAAAGSKTIAEKEKHTLKFFYLERASAVANCSLSFNMPVIPAGTVSVSKEVSGVAPASSNGKYTFVMKDARGSEPVVLKNVPYTINDPAGKVNYTDEKTGYFTLEAGDTAFFSSFTSEESGRYYFEEVDPGFATVTSKVNDRPEKAGLETDAFVLHPSNNNNVVFTNTMKTADFSFLKTDNKSGKPLPGATFGLFQGKNLVAEAPSGEDGKVVFTNIPFGNYQLKEISAPETHEVLDPAAFWDVTVDYVKDAVKTTLKDQDDDYAAVTGGDLVLIEEDVSAPADPAPADPASVDPAPADPASVDPAPADPQVFTVVNKALNQLTIKKVIEVNADDFDENTGEELFSPDFSDKEVKFEISRKDASDNWSVVGDPETLTGFTKVDEVKDEDGIVRYAKWEATKTLDTLYEEGTYKVTEISYPDYKTNGYAVDVTFDEGDIPAEVVSFKVDYADETEDTADFGLETNGFSVSDGQQVTVEFTNPYVHVPNGVVVEAAKVWRDDLNRDGKRPYSVTFGLFVGGEKIEEAVVNATTADSTATRTVEIEGVQYQDEVYEVSFLYDCVKYPGTPVEVREIAYTLKDGDEPIALEANSGVKWSNKPEDPQYAAPVTVVNDGTIEIINQYTPETWDLAVRKVWGENTAGRVTGNVVTIRLLANGKELAGRTDKAVNLSADNNWFYVYTNLYKYEAGKLIDYTVTEDSLGDRWSYKVEVEDPADFKAAIAEIKYSEEEAISMATEAKKAEMGEDAWNALDLGEQMRRIAEDITILMETSVVDTEAVFAGVERFVKVTNSYSPAGTNPYVPPVITPEPDPEPTPDPIVIPEEDVPLAELPEEDVPLAMLPEEDVPLALLPATGDASALWMALSALSGAGLFLTRKKRDEE